MALFNFGRSKINKFPIIFASYSIKFDVLSQEKKIKKCFRILGITEHSDNEQVRSAYLNLVKRFHPDSGTDEANAEKFQEIDCAFKVIIRQKSKERWNVEEVTKIVGEDNVKHTVPQHRQYLSLNGVGSGTPFEREKQYAKYRALQAAENVLQHRVAKVHADEKNVLDIPSHEHKTKTKCGIDRVVEDLIQEAMSKGKFDNLSGHGKPLLENRHVNPYVDFVTHKLNEILIENGFTPEWITLQKEIKEDIDFLRTNLAEARENPWKWESEIKKCEPIVKYINDKINKYNLVVPILNKQMFLINLEKEANNVLINGLNKMNSKHVRNANIESNQTGTTTYGNIFSLFEGILFREKS